MRARQSWLHWSNEREPEFELFASPRDRDLSSSELSARASAAAPSEPIADLDDEEAVPLEEPLAEAPLLLLLLLLRDEL